MSRTIVKALLRSDMQANYCLWLGKEKKIVGPDLVFLPRNNEISILLQRGVDISRLGAKKPDQTHNSGPHYQGSKTIGKSDTQSGTELP